MKVVKLFAPLLAILLLNSTLSINLLFKSPQNDYKKLTNFVCKITKDITKSTSDTQDVLIGNLGGKVWSLTVNDIAGCVGDENGVVITDFKKQLTEKSLRKASVVILTFQWIDASSIINLIQVHHFSTVWHHMTKIICIVSNKIELSQRLQVLDIFMNFGFLNVVIVHNSEISNVKTELFASLSKRITSYTDVMESSILFPDKLINMERFPYQVVIYEQSPDVRIINNKIISQMMYFLTHISDAQKASIRMILVQNQDHLSLYWKNRRMHLTLNSGVIFDSPEPKLLTYNEKGYCVLVPLPPKTSLTQLMLVKPFDGLTWLFFAITIAASVAVWWMFRSRGAVDSHWLLAYGFFVMFIGQGVDFSRRNRLVLAILLQLIILMVFVLNQAYEGVITSFMIQPIYENRLETFEQVLATDYEIMTDEAFGYIFKDSEEYEVMKPRINTSATKLGDQLGVEILRKHFVFISRCELAKTLIDKRHSNGRMVTDYYYLLPQLIMTFYEQLEASFLNPFIERLQYYMDLSFQAGLPQAWKLFASQNDLDRPHSQSSDELSYLKLEDMTQVFGILIIGYTVSTVVLLIEIFYHSCLKNLQKPEIGQMLTERINQMAYNKKIQSKDRKYSKDENFSISNRNKKQKQKKAEKLKVRKIFVQPKNSEMDEGGEKV